MKELEQYKIPIIFGAIGLVLALLFVSIGFFKTLLIIVLTGLGFCPRDVRTENGNVRSISKTIRTQEEFK